MESHPRISELLIKTGAYKDLDEPVILTSGELGIYYINTEKLAQDNGEFEKYGDDSRGMIKHALDMMDKHPTFGEVIDILARKASNLIAPDRDISVISGGQRRDWLFSGPVAYHLNLRHISVYKDGKIEMIMPDETVKQIGDNQDSLRDLCDVHFSDLLTEASSCYRVENGEKKGWIPWIEKRGTKVRNLVAVVTRLQGGEERLREIGINAEAFVAIDKDFLEKYSRYPARALAYLQNPKLWSENYLRENGALALIETFNPKGNKLDRIKKFLNRYGNVLAEANKWNELDDAVKEKYGLHLGQISGDID